MKFKLPPFPYPLDAFEPILSKNTLEHHYFKHHKAYIDKLNKLIENTAFSGMELEEIILHSFETKSNKKGDQKIFNNAAQAWNHTFFWSCINPDRLTPTPKVKEQFKKSFGSLESFFEKFSQEGKELFGSGWVWLVKDEAGLLTIVPKSNAENPLTDGQTPILVCDVWEHAYYLDYQEKRADYLDRFRSLINWSFVEKNLSDTHVFDPVLRKPKTEKNVRSLRH